MPSALTAHQLLCHSFSGQSELAALSTDSQVWADDRKRPIATLTSAVLYSLSASIQFLFLFLSGVFSPPCPHHCNSPGLSQFCSLTSHNDIRHKERAFLSFTVFGPMVCHIQDLLIGVMKDWEI